MLGSLFLLLPNAFQKKWRQWARRLGGSKDAGVSLEGGRPGGQAAGPASPTRGRPALLHPAWRKEGCGERGEAFWWERREEKVPSAHRLALLARLLVWSALEGQRAGPAATRDTAGSQALRNSCVCVLGLPVGGWFVLRLCMGGGGGGSHGGSAGLAPGDSLSAVHDWGLLMAQRPFPLREGEWPGSREAVHGFSLLPLLPLLSVPAGELLQSPAKAFSLSCDWVEPPWFLVNCKCL